jgi:phosphoribosylformylglycinamidine synthase
VDCNSRYVSVDPRRGAALAIMEGARNIACTGARPLGITNCLNFGNPMKPDNYYFFHEAISGMADACDVLGIPVTGGNVSFYNESGGRPVLPTPTIGMVGLMDNIENSVRMGFRDEGDFVVLLGNIGPDLGCSEYLSVIHKVHAGPPPRLDFDANKALIELLADLSEHKLICSAHDVSEGGLAVTLIESCLAENIGAMLTFPWKGRIIDYLFAETAGCVVVSVAHDQWSRFRHLVTESGVPLQMLGMTGGTLLGINDWILIDLDEARQIYEGAIPSLMTDAGLAVLPE